MKKPDKNAVQQYLASIGRKGGRTRAEKYGKNQLSEWAKLGGRPKKDKQKKGTK